jgi:protein-disulfide isomerase
MAAVHISRSEAANDFDGLVASGVNGDEIHIESNACVVAKSLPANAPRPWLFSEPLKILKGCGSTAVPHRPNHFRFFLALASIALLLVVATAHAQFGSQPAKTQVHDASALHPPAGARVAIIEFYDLECPSCASSNPILMKAAGTYKIPWIRHDFIIPHHIWSRIAAVNARWFDTKSKAIGDEYRDYIFANQNSIETPAQLAQWTGKFAQSHRIAVPIVVDPQGKLAADVEADTDLGRRTGVWYTPTIFIVSASNTKSPPYIEVLDHSKLYQIIERAIADAAPRPNP